MTDEKKEQKERFEFSTFFYTWFVHRSFGGGSPLGCNILIALVVIVAVVFYPPLVKSKVAAAEPGVCAILQTLRHMDLEPAETGETTPDVAQLIARAKKEGTKIDHVESHEFFRIEGGFLALPAKGTIWWRPYTYVILADGTIHRCRSPRPPPEPGNAPPPLTKDAHWEIIDGTK